jgi:subtilisin family serine protease
VACIRTKYQQFRTLTPAANEFYGLDRIDQRDLPLNNLYNYSDSGLVVYILDTGTPINPGQFTIIPDPFPGGPHYRSASAFDTFGGGGLDYDDHGSSVASIVAGITFGVAKHARPLSVKVCTDAAGCPASNVIAGINWIIANHQGVAVANMSFGGPPSSSEDTAVRNLMAAGVLAVIAAGNDNNNAAGHSPARVVEALTVGATMKDDSRASYSNFGAVDLYAPGGSVALSQAIPTAGSSGLRGFDGTSAAAPHVAGVAALYWQLNPTANAYEVGGAIKKGSTWNKVTNLPFAGPDNLLYSRFDMQPSHIGGTSSVYRYYNGVLATISTLPTSTN